MRELLNKYERVVEDDACHGGSILDVHGSEVVLRYRSGQFSQTSPLRKWIFLNSEVEEA